ncbi:MAG: glycine--tRNA ligase subunit beta [Syntrophales bacterium]
MGKELLLEIGTEEIPAAFFPKALTDMAEIAKRELADSRIPHGAIKTLGTPRRLFLSVAEVAERQEDQETEKLGPAKRACFDETGNPTQAASGFARGQGIDVSELETIITPKGEYVCARKKIAGAPTAIMLPSLLTKLISSLPFRKSMRWADLDFRFARPIHWILALYDGEIIPFGIGGVQSGNISYGHRFMSPAGFSPTNSEEYVSGLRERFVIVDPAEREEKIVAETKKAAENAGGSLFPAPGLLSMVTFLTEYPNVVCGSFDREYLKLPREVLTTTMISHQKYFPVVDEKGSLLPHFITINNTLPDDPDVVKRGNERVIRARLADARFFFEADQKIPLEARVADLKKIVFHTLLGTSYEKTLRFQELASWIAGIVEPDAQTRVKRAALLAKADLGTQMVGEFAELQGIMGREYALLSGEDPLVAKAIYEHYLPTAAGGDLPETGEGAIVGIADKLDSICGFFGVGLLPTGTADPYALRRQALGIINIILAKRYPLSLGAMIDKSLAILAPLLKKPASETKDAVLEFFKGRLQNQLAAQSFSYDVIDAVLAADIDDLVSTYEKIRAMETFKTDKDYQILALAFKRVENITRGVPNGTVHPEVFCTPEEKSLHESFLTISEAVSQDIANGDYNMALRNIARLQKPVDKFFETVLVMAEEEEIRVNRLSLLKNISFLFHKLADFSKIVTE